MRARRPILVSRGSKLPAQVKAKEVAAKEVNTTQVIRFISAIVKTVVGEDEDPSPLLKSLIEDLGVDVDDVEIAQDITLLAIDIMESVSRAVDSGSAASLPYELVTIIGPAIPEIQEDIERIKK